MTRPVIERLMELARMPGTDMPSRSREMARLSLLDWVACLRAGASEPVTLRLAAYLDSEGGAAAAQAVGGRRMPMRAAALLNATASHALDYDDTHFAHIGHLSAGIYGAALAVGEAQGAGLESVVEAFLAGAEGAILTGLALGRDHYDIGYHQTATAGAFGATLAAGRLMGLDEPGMRAALGLCSTRASGLRNQFGTMGKPLNAGYAASTGVECAALAKAGLTSAQDGLEGAQGFLVTHHGAGTLPEEATGRFLFEDIQYKLHACCHGTHAMLEALAHLKARETLSPERVSRLVLRTSPRWLTVCDLKAPRTGLEVKFSYGWLASMSLSGVSTADPKVYTDALAAEAAFADLAERVDVIGDASVGDMQAEVELHFADGRKETQSHDLAAPVPLEDLTAKLREKARLLMGAEAEELAAMILSQPQTKARELGAMVAGAGA
ncbi:MmgE/PrpD family protein [Mameliella sediminis]|uniref:MmgE/PrpD family protein n=1 Tax=Mameliella sediminis TaxID=2836866 RepID=UPI001C441093|nr:MmgE/PrpD family protein [Mameliella sediminis]MBV7394064.1 MmgE/PrpD family protein [Mameliella sediminis]